MTRHDYRLLSCIDSRWGRGMETAEPSQMFEEPSLRLSAVELERDIERFTLLIYNLQIKRESFFPFTHVRLVTNVFVSIYIYIYIYSAIGYHCSFCANIEYGVVWALVGRVIASRYPQSATLRTPY